MIATTPAVNFHNSAGIANIARLFEVDYIQLLAAEWGIAKRLNLVLNQSKVNSVHGFPCACSSDTHHAIGKRKAIQSVWDWHAKYKRTHPSLSTVASAASVFIFTEVCRQIVVTLCIANYVLNKTTELLLFP